MWDLSPERFKKFLVLLFLLGLVIRVGFFVERSHSPSFGILTLDQKYYDAVARMLLAGEDLHDLRGFRPLLYPMFLALIYQAGGAWGIPLAIAVQHLLGAATGVIVALCGWRLFGHRFAGLLGGCLFLLAPVPLYFEGELLIEPGYTFLICASLLLLLRAAETEGWQSGMLWLFAGAFTSFAAQARPNILIFLVIYPLFAMWLWWRARAIAALRPLLGLLGAFAMAIPWGFVNLKQSDHFHLLPNAGGINLYVGNNRAADGLTPLQGRRVSYGDRYQDPVEVWAREEYQAAMLAQGRTPDNDPAAISKYWTLRTVDEIKSAPTAWIQLIVKKAWLSLWNIEIPNNRAFAFLQEESVWLRWLPVRWVVLFMLLPVGVWAALKHCNRGALIILLGYVLFYSAGNLAFTICDRYRYPVWPAMAAIAGVGLGWLIQKLLLRDRRTVIAAVAAMSLMAAIAVPNWYAARLPTFARDYLFRSIAWYEKGHLPEALADVDRSLGLDSSDPTALQQRGNVLAGLNRLSEAKQTFELALRLSPNEAPTWNNLGAVYEQLGATNQALHAFQRATECKPPSGNAFLSLACLQLRVGLLQDAATTLAGREAHRRSPDAPALAVRSVLARRLGDAQWADALEAQARTLDADATAWALNRTGNR